jgi:hypothetical protein
MAKKESLSNDDKVKCYWKDSVFYIDPQIFHEALFLQKRGSQPVVRYDNGAELFHVSKGEFRKLARDAEAVHKHYGTVFVNVNEVCRFIESLGSDE